MHTISFPATSGWEDWYTFKNFPKISLEAGERKIRMMYLKTPFNLDWVLFDEFTGEVLGLELDDLRINVFPNPTQNILNIKSDYNPEETIKYKLINSRGKILYKRSRNYENGIDEIFNLNKINSGLVFLVIIEGNNLLEIKKIFIDQ